MTAIQEQPPQRERPIDLASLVQLHQAGTWRYLRYLGADSTEAADLTQETFLAFARARFAERNGCQTNWPGTKTATQPSS